VDASRFDEYTSGTGAFVLAYLLIGVCAFFGHQRAHGDPRGLLWLPIRVILLVIIAAIAVEAVQWLVLHVVHVNLNPFGTGVLNIATLMAVGFAGGFFWVRRGLQDARVLRGAQVLDRIRHPLGSRRLKREAPGISLAGVAVAPEDEVKHFKLIGATGTGKSTLIRELLHGALRRGDRALVVDPDGGYLSRFYQASRGDVILNPFDARSARWDLFAEIRTDYDTAQLARSLIPERGSDPQWPGFARTFFESVMDQARASGISDLDEFCRLLTSASQSELRPLLAGTPAASFTEEGSIKLFLGQRSTASEHLKCLEYIRRQRAPLFSVKEWVRSGKGVLFLPYQADQIAAIRSIISTWARLAIYQTMSLGEGDHRLWFAIDELDALGAIDGLPDALVRLRRFGGRCLIGFQSIGQVSATFGQGPAEAIVENCGSTVILRCSASERGGTSRFASQLIGDRHVVRTTQTRNRTGPSLFGGGASHDSSGESEHHATEPAVMASEIEQLPDRAGFLKLPSHPAWMSVGFPVYELPKVAEPFVPYQ
jgi:Type IV secretion-system coupling protein DNA-binding domain